MGTDQVAHPRVGQLAAHAREGRADRQQNKRRDPGDRSSRSSAAGCRRTNFRARSSRLSSGAYFRGRSSSRRRRSSARWSACWYRRAGSAARHLRAMLSRPHEMSGRSRRSEGTHLAPLHRHRLDLQGQRRVAAALLERAVAREHLGEHHPQRVDVRSPIDLADQRGRAADQGAEVLGSHVGHRSRRSWRARRRHRWPGERLKSSEQRLPLGADEDVGRLDVAVQNSALVRVVQAVGELRHDPCGRALVAELDSAAAGVMAPSPVDSLGAGGSSAEDSPSRH